MHKKNLFLLLGAFKFTGGLEKFNSAFLKAFYELSLVRSLDFFALSLQDEYPDERYIPGTNFKGLKSNNLFFLLTAIIKIFQYDLIILGHINLAIIGVIQKILFRNKPLIIIVHGIEVWDELSIIKKTLLKKSDLILAVSNFTRNKIIEKHLIEPAKIKIFPNTLDPYFTAPEIFSKPKELLKRYNISLNTNVLLTVARLFSVEKYKGYDKVISILPNVLKEFPDSVYIIIGKYNLEEKRRLEEIIKKENLTTKVIFTGFIPEDELVEHYLLSDLYVMPSKKEGFGIVFIEAMSCGVPVVTGKNCGSDDINVQFEHSVGADPDNQYELGDVILSMLRDKISDNERKNMQISVVEKYGYNSFKHNLDKIVLNNS